jgi:signal peptidase II
MISLSKLNRRKRLLLLLPAAMVLLADQATKALIRANMYLGQSIPPEGTFRLTYVTNPYGLFGFDGFWNLYFRPIHFIIGTAIVVVLVIWLYFSYHPMRGKLASTGLGLLLGGAVGNLMDRIFLGAVTDFIDVRLWEGFRWPTFNIADASLTTGIFILIVCLLIIAKDTQ